MIARAGIGRGPIRAKKIWNQGVGPSPRSSLDSGNPTLAPFNTNVYLHLQYFLGLYLLTIWPVLYY